MNQSTKIRVETALSLLLFLLVILGALRYQYYMLNALAWEDESETIVISKLLAAGSRLYSEVFSQHGPLVFLPGIVLEQFGDFKHQGFRVVIAVGQLIALYSIYKSPLFNNRVVARFYTGFAATVLLVYMHSYLAHMYMYHSIAGIMMVIILAQYTLPSIVMPERVSRAGRIVGNVLIAALPFAAITYTPAALLLFTASLRREHLRQVLISASSSAVFNIVFLVLIGSISGYLAIHVYLNIVIYSHMAHITLGGFTDILHTIVRLMTGDLSAFLISVAILLSFVKLSSFEAGFPWRSGFIIVAMAVFMIRGAGFGSLPYYYAALAFPLVYMGGVNKLSTRQFVLLMMFSLLCFAKLALVLPGEKRQIKRVWMPASTEYSRLVNRMTDADDRIISYSFRNFEYVVAARLPASGNIYYLPQQEIFSKAPVLGIEINACGDIKRNKPKLMMLNQWTAWGEYSWKDYGKCIQAVANTDYVKVLNKPYYIRRDFLRSYMEDVQIENADGQPSLREIMSVQR